MRDDATWIQTFTGKQFWPLEPRIEDVDILDIAHGLSLNCRFSGQCDDMMSVAQHSVIVSEHVPEALALRGLLHDASEAYIPDIGRPIKPAFPVFVEVEARLLHIIGLKFGIPDLEVKNAVVKDADNRTLMTEKRDNMKPEPAPWALTEEPYDDLRIISMESSWAERIFLVRFGELYRVESGSNEYPG